MYSLVGTSKQGSSAKRTLYILLIVNILHTYAMVTVCKKSGPKQSQAIYLDARALDYGSNFNAINFRPMVNLKVTRRSITFRFRYS